MSKNPLNDANEVLSASRKKATPGVAKAALLTPDSEMARVIKAEAAIKIAVSTDVESAVIAAILTSPSALESTFEILDADDFSSPAYQEIFAAAVALEATGRPVDQITVADYLSRNKTLAHIGGPARLSELAAAAGEVVNVAEHARIISEKAKLRRLGAAGRSIVSSANAADALSDDVMEKAEKAVFDIGRPRGGSTLTDMPRAVDDLLIELESNKGAPVIGVPTGLASLDHLTGGFRGGQLIVVAARPGVGKSAWSLQVARHIAETTGKAVPVLSYEMSRNEIMLRLLSSVLGYDSTKLGRYDIPVGMEKDLLLAAERIRNMPLLVDDNPSETIGGVRSAMRRLGRRVDIGAIVIDYLQLMNGDKSRNSENRVNEIAEISRGLKRLASDLGVPIIALSQLNRAVELRPNKRPVLSDLRDSGAVEQDANIVLFLFREHMYNSAADPSIVEAIVAKNRSGPVGTVLMRMNPATASFTDAGASTGAFSVAPPHQSAFTSRAADGSDPFGGAGNEIVENPFTKKTF